MTSTHLKNSIAQLVQWTVRQPNKPHKTSLHVAALLYRGHILIDPRNGKLIASINQRDACAERQLLRLCKKAYRKQPELSLRNASDKSYER